MKKIITILVILSGLAVISGAASSSRNEVALLYHGVSGVNKEAMNHLRQEVKKQGADFDFKPVSVTSSFNPEDFKAVVILNTGQVEGIDPAISDFLSVHSGLSRMILVNLIKGSQEYKVEVLAPSDATGGVDAVSASSLWKAPGLGGFKKKREIRAMHDEWTGLVFDMIEQEE